MKLTSFFLSLLFFNAISIAQPTNQWTWVSGYKTGNEIGAYGTKGISGINNVPGSRERSHSWVDFNGNLWLFGGLGYDGVNSSPRNLNDLWFFNTKSKEWTWVSGDNVGEQLSEYGAKLIPNEIAKPGARKDGVTWADNKGNLWLFGGYGLDKTTNGAGRLNDLWKYNIKDKQWAWISGNDIVNQVGKYGSKLVPSALNTPGARENSISWTDKFGNLWLFGGYGLGTGVSVGWLNDLWKFNPSTNEWTWVDGITSTNSFGTYGTKGIPGSSNTPGARENSISWVDINGNLWLYGGFGYGANIPFTSIGRLSDLWKFDIVNNQWIWINGSNTTEEPGTYGTKGLASALNSPSSRENSISWVDGKNNLWLFGGFVKSPDLSYKRLNDLWKFDISNNQWTWISGSNDTELGSYGQKNIPSNTNIPGGRENSVSFYDGNGNLWLHGGFGYDGSGFTSIVRQNDLWKFNVLNCDNINFNPLADTISICGSQLNLDAGAGFTSYLWNTEETSRVINVTKPGFYSVKVLTPDGCVGRDTAMIAIINGKIKQSDTLICKGATVSISIDTSSLSSDYCSFYDLQPNLTSNLELFYPFCGNANDISENNKFGYVTGATLCNDRFNKSDKAYSFKRGQLISSSSFLSLPTTRTFNFWGKINNHNATPGFDIISFNSDFTINIGKWGVNNNCLVVYKAGAWHGVSNLKSDNQWHMYTVVCKGNQSTNISFYEDGKQLSSIINSGNYNYSNLTGQLLVGIHVDTSYYSLGRYEGDLDDIGIWRRALSTNEIQQLYTNKSILWSTGETSNSINVTPSQTTKYWVRVTDGIASCSDTIQVSISQPDTSLSVSNLSICQGQSTLLTAGNNKTYQWYKDGTAIQNATSKTYSAVQSGVYYARVTSNENCLDSTRKVTINVGAPPNAQINALGNTSFCQGGSVTLNANSGSGLSYQWKLNGTDIPSATNASYVASTSGSYSVTVSNNSNCSAISNTINVTIGSNPTATITTNNSTSFCEGGSVVLNANTGTGLQYQWLRDGNTINNATQNSYTATVSGQYTVRVTNSQNCSTTSTSTQVTVNPLPNGTLSTPASNNICGSTPVTLTASGGSTYQWYKDNNKITGANSANYSATTSGVYTVELISAENCKRILTTSISLTAFTKPTVAFVNNSTCAGRQIQFTNTSVTSNSGTITWKWVFGSSGTSNQQNPTFTFANPGTYNVKLVVSSQQCPDLSDSLTKVLTIESPIPSIRYATLNSITGSPLNLNARNIGTAYNWRPPTGLSNPSIFNPTANLSAEQQYLIDITLPNGCVITDTLLVRNFKEKGIFVPGAFTPNGDGQNDKLYPILIGMKQLKSFKVFNRWGNLVFETTDVSIKWDGTYKGQLQPMETYVWLIEVIDLDGNIIKKGGNTLLIR